MNFSATAQKQREAGLAAKYNYMVQVRVYLLDCAIFYFDSDLLFLVDRVLSHQAPMDVCCHSFARQASGP